MFKFDKAKPNQRSRNPKRAECWANEDFLSIAELKAAVKRTDSGSAAVQEYLRRQDQKTFSRQAPAFGRNR
jgi:hypothetical protein